MVWRGWFLAVLLFWSGAAPAMTPGVPLDPFAAARTKLQKFAPSDTFWNNREPFLVCSSGQAMAAVAPSLAQLSRLLGTPLRLQESAKGCVLSVEQQPSTGTEAHQALVLDVAVGCPPGTPTCNLTASVLNTANLSKADQTALRAAHSYLVDAGLLGLARSRVYP